MKDKKQNWDELDYSDENQQGYDEEEQYEDDASSTADDSEEYEDDEEYDEEESDRGKKGGLNKAVIVIVLLLLLGGGGYFLAQHMSAGNVDSPAGDMAAQQVPRDEMQTSSGNDFFSNQNENSQDMMDVSFNENGDTNINNNNNGENTGQDVITVSDAPNAESTDSFINSSLEEQNQSNDSIMVSYNKAARLNPFKPPVIAANEKKHIPYAVVDDTEFEIVEPPEVSVPDENLTNLLQTQISGIMYDPESPSAIINLNGTDYFVKIGDKVSGYLIKNITRDKVQVNYKNNTYVASVGQLFTKGVLEQQNVPDFEHKFAGRYKNSK